MTISSIDRSVLKTQEWLKELRKIGDFERDTQAYSALRAALQTLRDRLTPGEAADLASELPMVIRGFYFEGWKPDGPQHKERTREAFLERVRERLRGVTPAVDAETATRATFELLERKITQGEIRDVKSMLPRAVRAELWGASAGDP